MVRTAPPTATTSATGEPACTAAENTRNFPKKPSTGGMPTSVIPATHTPADSAGE